MIDSMIDSFIKFTKYFLTYNIIYIMMSFPQHAQETGEAGRGLKNLRFVETHFGYRS